MDDILAHPPRPLTWLPGLAPLQTPPRDPRPTLPGEISRPFPLGSAQPRPHVRATGVSGVQTGGFPRPGTERSHVDRWTDRQADTQCWHRQRAQGPAHACPQSWDYLKVSMSLRGSGVGVPVLCPHPWSPPLHGTDETLPPRRASPFRGERQFLSGVTALLPPAPRSRVPAEGTLTVGATHSCLSVQEGLGSFYQTAVTASR